MEPKAAIVEAARRETYQRFRSSCRVAAPPIAAALKALDEAIGLTCVMHGELTPLLQAARAHVCAMAEVDERLRTDMRETWTQHVAELLSEQQSRGLVRLGSCYIRPDHISAILPAIRSNGACVYVGGTQVHFRESVDAVAEALGLLDTTDAAEPD